MRLSGEFEGRRGAVCVWRRHVCAAVLSYRRERAREVVVSIRAILQVTVACVLGERQVRHHSSQNILLQAPAKWTSEKGVTHTSTAK